MDYSLRHDLIRCAPGTSTPVGWYPLTLTAERILISRGWKGIAARSWHANLAGMALSGILCGGMATLAGERWRLAVHAEQSASGPPAQA